MNVNETQLLPITRRRSLRVYRAFYYRLHYVDSNQHRLFDVRSGKKIRVGFTIRISLSVG